MPKGNYKFQAVATSGSVSASYQLSWKNDYSGKGTYTVKCAGESIGGPNPNVLKSGGQTEVTCEVRSFHGFSGPVSLDCPTKNGITCSPSQNPVTPPPNGSAPVTFRLTAPKDAEAGGQFFINHSGDVDGQNFPFPYMFSVLVVRPTLFASCAGTDITLEQGGAGTVTCQLQSSNGYDDEVSIVVQAEGYVTPVLSRQTARAGEEFQVRFEAPTTGELGSYNFTIHLTPIYPQNIIGGSYTIVAAPPGPIVSETPVSPPATP